MRISFGFHPQDRASVILITAQFAVEQQRRYIREIKQIQYKIELLNVCFTIITSKVNQTLMDSGENMCKTTHSCKTVKGKCKEVVRNDD